MTGGDGLTPAEVAALADRITAAVIGCPAVAGMAEVPGAPVATYLAGRIVSGVAVRPGEAEVSVVARYGLRLPEVAAQVRQAVVPLVPGWVVHVVIGGIAEPAPDDVPAPDEERAGGP